MLIYLYTIKCHCDRKFPLSFTVVCDGGIYPDKGLMNDMIPMFMDDILCSCKDRPFRSELPAVVFKIVV